MTKNFIHTHVEEVPITPEAPVNSTTSQTGNLKKLIGRAFDRLSRITGNPWYQDPDYDLKQLFQFIQESRNAPLVGGGNIAFSSGRVTWTTRFVLVPLPNEQGSSYFIEIAGPPPTSGVTDNTGVERANASGILLNSWDSLWVVHTRGGNETSGVSLRVAAYNSALSDTYFTNPNAYRICTRISDGGYDYVEFANGARVSAGGIAYSGGVSHSIIAGTQEVKAANTAPLRVTNTQNTGAGSDIGADNFISYRDAEGDEQWWLGVNDEGNLEAGTELGGKGMVFWDTSVDALRSFYHEGNHARLYSVKHVRTAATSNTTLSGTQTINGVNLGVNDRVGLFGQTTGSQNGIYSVQSGAWVRVSDMNEASEFYSGLLVMVNEGALAGTLYRLATPDPITPGSTALTFSAIAGGGAVTGHNFWSATHPDIDAADTPANGDVPTFDGSTSKWKASPVYVDDTLKTGLGLTYVSANSVQIETGAAYVPGEGRVLVVNSPIVKSGLVLTSGTWYYFYLYNNGGTPDVLVSTTAPAASYRGDARHMSANDDYRYLGAIKASGANTLYRWSRLNDLHQYQVDTNVSPFEVLAGGNQTVWTSVGTADLVPPHVRWMQGAFFANQYTASFGTPGILAVTYIVSNSNQAGQDRIVGPLMLDSSRQFAYKGATIAGCNAHLLGYYDAS